jgi:AcrR family transcriptional regulator
VTQVRRDAITPNVVLDTAMAIIEGEGVEGFTMRRLANELGVRTPTVYWHVGSRQDILAKLIERLADDFGGIEPDGDTPAERIASVCTVLLAEVRRRPHVIAVSRTAGRGEAIFVRVQEILAREVTAAGLHGREAAFALRAILFQLGGFMLFDHAVAHDTSLHGAARWDVDDADLRADLGRSVDVDEIFRYSLESLLVRLFAR